MVTALEPNWHHRSAIAHPWPAAPVPQRVDIGAAMECVAAVVPPTPLVRSDHLSDRYERSVFLKLEMMSPVRSFKHRGALVAIDALAQTGRFRSIVTASTGNHGQGVAYAGRRLGLPVVVLSPSTAAAEKLNAMRALGADVRVVGADLGEAQEIGESMATETIAYLEDGENPELMAGAATVTTEILASRPNTGAIIYPMGGGNLIAGALLATRHFDAATPEIIGVQSTAAPAVTMSWLDGELRHAPCSTFAGGLATTRPGELALSVMVADLTAIGLVTEEDLRQAMAISMLTSGIAVEGASASPIAALERHGHAIDHDEVVLVLTGNWCSQSELADAVSRMATK